MTNHKNITQQSIFTLSWPIFIDIFLHFLTIMINTFMVNRVSKELLASMAIGNQIFELCITIFNFIAVGCSVVIAQYRGAGQFQMVNKSINISIAVNILMGVICTSIILIFGKTFIMIMNLDPSLHQYAWQYLSILGICLLFEAITIILASVLRVHGKMKTTMYITLITNVITVIGNIIALYYFESGLKGVAISTLFGRFVCVSLLLFLFTQSLQIKIQLFSFHKESISILKKILHIGLPAVGENLAWLLHFMVATSFVALLGTNELAAHNLYFQLSHFIMLFGIAISIGNEIIIGHLIGANKTEQAYKRAFNTLKLGVIATAVLSVLFYLFSSYILNFVTEDTIIVQILLPICLLSVFLEPGRTLNICMVNSLRASGDAKFPLYTALIFMWGVSIPLGYVLAIKFEMGLIGIWIGSLCDEWLRGLTNTYRWYSKKWQNKSLVSQ